MEVKTEKEIKKTICSIFMVPLLKIPRDSLINNGFINGFIKDDMREEQYENAIYLLFKPQDIDRFREFLDSEYERTKRIIDDYDHHNGFVVVVYQLDAKFETDFNLIKRGRYSKTSPNFQAEFPKTVKLNRGGIVKEDVSLQYRVFNKTEDLVKFWEDMFGVRFDEKQELWHRFSEEEETLTEDKLREYL